MTRKKPLKMLRGQQAIEAALRGAQLYVLNEQTGWVEGGPEALSRALRMEPYATWVYGVLAKARGAK